MTEEELYLDIEAGLRRIDIQRKYRIGQVKLEAYLQEYELETPAPCLTKHKRRKRADMIEALKRYKAQGLDIAEIAEIENVYPSTVNQWHAKNGLTPNPPKSKQGRPQKEELRHLYHVLEWNMTRIAAHYGTNIGRVNGWIGYYELRKYKKKPKDNTVRHLPAHVNEI